MRNRFFIGVRLLGGLLLGLSLPLAAAADAWKAGDTVAWVGDSITHGGSYHSVVQLFDLTRNPTAKIEYFNAGIGGDRASAIMGVAKPFRFDHDVLSRKPTVATIMLGMNDINRGDYDDPKVTNLEKRASFLAVYETNMVALIGALQKGGVRVILLTPSIYDETAILPDQKRAVSFGANAALGLCAEKMKDWSVKHKTGLVDFWGRMTKLNAEVQKTNENATIVGKDRIHPGPLGHFIMAYAMLKDLGASPVVSTVLLDAKKSVPVALTNAKLTGWKASPKEVSFELLEGSLPFPVTGSIETAAELVPFQSELNREWFAVTSLPAGNWKLAIDEVEIGTFSAADLAKGMNLAERKNTPQMLQSLEIAASNEVRMKIAQMERNLVSLEYGYAKKGLDPIKDGAKVREAVRKLVDDQKTKDPAKVKLEWTMYLDDAARKAALAKHATTWEWMRKAAAPKAHLVRLTLLP